MPPKVKITKEEIVRVSLDIVRKSGAEALNARAVAQRLGCSTQPVFSNYPSMRELRKDVLAKGYELYNEYVTVETGNEKFTPYKASGMAYIKFAKEEKQLFRLLFMRDRSEEKVTDKGEMNSVWKMICENTGMDMEMAKLFHLEMWSFVHGIAVMSATSYQPISSDLASEMLTDVYEGMKYRFREKNNER